MLKITKKHRATLSIEDTFFKRPQRGATWHPSAPRKIRVKNEKNSEKMIIFIQNKKIISLRLRWQIFRGYRFVAEVIFKRKHAGKKGLITKKIM